jgi:hypothetical protein
MNPKSRGASFAGDYFDPAFLLAAQRAFISSESLLRPAGVSAPLFLVEVVLVPAAFLLAIQRAFISWESFLLPAGVSPPFFFLGATAFLPALILAQRALVAAASFARVAADT